MELLFLLKKIVTPFFLPVTVVFVLLVAGTAIIWRSKKQQRWGKILLLLGVLLLTLAGYGFFTERLTASLENRYPPLTNPESVIKNKKTVYIIVLGGGSYDDPRLPASSRLAPESLIRLLEGIRLHNRLPDAKLILSGGAVFQDVPEAVILAETALLMGARQKDLILESKSLDTAGQAREISALIGKAPCILVTSAIHMPRSMALFHRRGMTPVPAPTNFLTTRHSRLQPGNFFPNATSLRRAEAAIHEYLGLMALKFQ
ncbi:MAG: YdcF family protein [Syntrophobacterales bacterium]|nr:YdcF family protein [Syntrophobacterales bacterium]